MSTPVLRVRLPAELRVFLAPRNRRAQVEVRHEDHASLGHVVESLGVPLTEVGALLIDGRRAAPAARPAAGSVIDVHPVPRPQRIPDWRYRFLLDVHLGTLARRLRLLGIDTAYRNDADDDTLLTQAGEQRRVLLTRDRGLLRRHALWAGGYVHGDRPAEQLADVLDRFAPPRHPWTRCTACNGELRPVRKRDVVAELEPGTRRSYQQFARCGDCGRIYWHGAHGRRLDALVRAVGG